MILLDTHILVWAITGDTGRLRQDVLDDIDRAISRGEAAVSAATFWELEIKRRKPQGNLPDLPPVKGLRSGVLRRGLAEVPITGSLWVDAVSLTNEGFHQDPADQLIVATAIHLDCELLTSDSKILAWAKQTKMIRIYQG
ncbi:MAG: type II toxin-antitoxin system VapC family toxin [bacterium]|nr:type II toxin-antitoxin system VapC family toxin [bacterium]MCY4273232.1 type II toxin-antitoxin system VapC family toxin [bacterium]